MINWRQTGWLVGLAGLLLAFILLVERHSDPGARPVQPAERLLASLRADTVASVEVRGTNQPPIRVERSATQWKLVSPLAYPAAPVAIERLLQALGETVVLTRISPREALSRGQKPSDFGLEPPAWVVTLEAGGQRLQVQFGAPTAAGGQVYAQVAGQPDIAVVDARLLDLLPDSPNAWRNLALIEPVAGGLDHLEVVAPGSGFRLERDATNRLWYLAQPRLRADPFKVETLLETIARARVVRFVTDDPNADVEPYGLATPRLECLVGSGTNPPQRLLFGGSPPGDTTNVYARLMNRQNVVLVPRAVAQALDTTPLDLRERRLLSLDPAAVTQVEVRGAESFTLRRETNEAWTAGETIAADRLLVLDWLQRLARLEVAEFVKDVVTDFGAYGLAPPARAYVLKTTLTNGAGPTNIVLGELHFGSNTIERVYARRADEDAVYAVNYLDYYRMPAAPWQFRERRVWNFTTNQVRRVVFQQNGLTMALVRTPQGEWTLAPGSQGLFNPLAADEMLFRLGELQAVSWAARGRESLAGLGFTETNLQVRVELAAGETNQTLTLDFGGFSPGRFPYAATVLDGQVWVFEFPAFLLNDLERAFGLPLRIPGRPAASRPLSNPKPVASAAPGRAAAPG